MSMLKLVPIALFSFLLGITSCEVSKKPQELTGNKTFDSLVNIHFPSQFLFEYENSTLPVFEDEIYLPDDFLNKGAYVRKSYKLSDSEAEQLTKTLKKTTSRIKHREACTLCAYKDNSIYRTDCDINDPPLSVFFQERQYFGITTEFLGDDFDIYIVDSKKGKYIPNRHLAKTICSEYWSHGFTRGVAISKKKGLAIYWVQFW